MGRESRERLARAHCSASGLYQSITHWGLWVQCSPSSSSPLTDCQLRQDVQGCRRASLGYQASTLFYVWPRWVFAPRNKVKASTWSPWLLYPTDKPVTSWDCGWLTNCSLLPPHVHMCIHLSPHPLPQTARNKMSLIFQVCSPVTLENPSRTSLMLNKEMC